MEKPTAPPSLFSRLLLLVVGVVCLPILVRGSPKAPAVLRAVGLFATEHRSLYAGLASILLALVIALVRAAIHLWMNEIRPRLAKTHTTPTSYAVPFKRIDLLGELSALQKSSCRAGQYFVGA